MSSVSRVAWVFVFVALALLTSREVFAAGPTFEQLVAAGDRARAARHWEEAVIAYDEAKKLRDDLTVVGRLGLVLVELREMAAAATQLHRVIEEPTAIPSEAERDAFSTAYRIARDGVLRLEITIDHAGARFELDGRVIFEGPTDFWMFVDPGLHELRTSLEGFEDDIRQITAERGERVHLNITLHAKTSPPTPAAHSAPTAPPNVLSKDKSAAAEPPKGRPEADKPRMRPSGRGQFALGAGPALVFGATPGVAVGAQIFGQWRRGWFGVRLDARGAVMIEHLKKWPDLHLLAWSVDLAPCVHWRVVFGCALVQVDGLALDTLATDYALDRNNTRLGLGLRGGFDFRASDRVRVQIWGDVVGHGSGHLVQARELSVWRSPPLFGAFGGAATVMF